MPRAKMVLAGNGTASFWKDVLEPGTPAALASPRCCPTVARPTTAEPPPKRTGSNAQALHTRAENPDGCDTPTASPWMYDTSMSCHSKTAAFAFTTKPGFPMRATNCARNSSRQKPDSFYNPSRRHSSIGYISYSPIDGVSTWRVT